MQSNALDEQQLARVVLESQDDDMLVLSVPGTSYQLHLVPGVSGSKIRTTIGKRITGVIQAKALRMHKAGGGGRFIEPICGHPRIVQGEIISIDSGARRVLVNVVVPMWIEAMAAQDLGEFAPGDLVNFYVASGATFTPAG